MATMLGMRLDHLSYAAGPDGLAGTARRIGELLGEEFRDGGIHPRFGTRNMVLPLSQGTYLEVVEVLDHPASDKAPFGQAVRARSALGGGWLGWVVCCRRHRPGRGATRPRVRHGNRHRPDGVELRWRQIGVNGLQADPQLPFFVQWESPETEHPSAGRQRAACTWTPSRSPATRTGSTTGSATRRRTRSRTSRSSGSRRTALPAWWPRSSTPPHGLVRI